MFIRELSLSEFKEFAASNNYSSYRQTLNYALLKSENDYEYEIIGFVDQDNNIYAAALVLVKMLDGYLYAYIPEGFLADYTNESILQEFTNALYKYYKKEDIVFIKINPRIPIAEINPKTHEKKYNDNYRIIRILEHCGYDRLNNSVNFESALPQINAFVDLDSFNINGLSKNTKNKIRKATRKGLILEHGNIDNINYLNEFVKRKVNRSEFYFNDYYNIFNKDNSIDYFLVSIDYERYIINSQYAYDKETTKNQRLNEKVRKKPGTKNINAKMNSDRALISYKNDIALATKNMNLPEKHYIAGALVIKHKDTVSIVISGFDKKYGSFSPNYFLFYEICKYYKNEFKYLDLDGLTSDFSTNNKYHGLNSFKLGFNPIVYEYIGEFDYVINRHAYNHLVKKGLLQKEFTNEK